MMERRVWGERVALGTPGATRIVAESLGFQAVIRVLQDVRMETASMVISLTITCELAAGSA